jgi:hypothetical protein
MTSVVPKTLQNERPALAAANTSVATPTFSASSSVMPQELAESMWALARRDHPADESDPLRQEKPKRRQMNRNPPAPSHSSNFVRAQVVLDFLKCPQFSFAYENGQIAKVEVLLIIPEQFE